MTITPEELREHYRAIGAKGGKAGIGKSKARSSAMARRAALVRWGKHKQTKNKGN